MSKTLITTDPTVAFEELASSPRERFTEAGFEATRLLKCAWQDRIELCNQLLGSVQGSGPQAMHVTPARYPHFPRAQVRAVTIEPFDSAVDAHRGNEQVADYQHARLTVQYATGSYDTHQVNDDPHGDTYVTESLEPTAEFVTLSPQGLFWENVPASSGKVLAEDEAPGKIIRGMDWIYTRHLLPTVPQAAFSLIGSVNDAAVDSRTLGYRFAPGTLLYNPPTIRRVITAQAAAAWDLTYRFSYRPATWNKVWRTATGSFEPLYNEQGPYQIYPGADFASLLE